MTPRADFEKAVTKAHKLYSRSKNGLEFLTSYSTLFALLLFESKLERMLLPNLDSVFSPPYAPVLLAFIAAFAPAWCVLATLQSRPPSRRLVVVWAAAYLLMGIWLCLSAILYSNIPELQGATPEGVRAYQYIHLTLSLVFAATGIAGLILGRRIIVENG